MSEEAKRDCHGKGSNRRLDSMRSWRGPIYGLTPFQRKPALTDTAMGRTLTALMLVGFLSQAEAVGQLRAAENKPADKSGRGALAVEAAAAAEQAALDAMEKAAAKVPKFADPFFGPPVSVYTPQQEHECFIDLQLKTPEQRVADILAHAKTTNTASILRWIANTNPLATNTIKGIRMPEAINAVLYNGHVFKLGTPLRNLFDISESDAVQLIGLDNLAEMKATKIPNPIMVRVDMSKDGFGNARLGNEVDYVVFSMLHAIEATNKFARGDVELYFDSAVMDGTGQHRGSYSELIRNNLREKPGLLEERITGTDGISTIHTRAPYPIRLSSEDKSRVTNVDVTEDRSSGLRTVILKMNNGVSATIGKLPVVNAAFNAKATNTIDNYIGMSSTTGFAIRIDLGTPPVSLFAIADNIDDVATNVPSSLAAVIKLAVKKQREQGKGSGTAVTPDRK